MVETATSTSDERKLWFDYIKTLNERQLHNTQRSGITTYVLIASLIGLFYKFGPQFPQFIAEPETVKISITIFVLLTVLLSSLFAAIAAIESYCAGEGELRAAPRSSEPVIAVVYGLLALAALAFICLEVRVAISAAGLRYFGKSTLLVHAAWLASSVTYVVLDHFRTTRKARKFKNMPRFNPFRVPPMVNLISLGVSLVWLVFGNVVLIAYLGPIPGYGLRPLKAASISLIVILILSYMLLRSIAEVTQQRYFALERDIVLNRLTPSEIRSRYLRDLSGPDMAQWLDDALTTLEAREDRLQRSQDSAREKLQEIQKINPEYTAERRERARLAVKDLVEAMDDNVSHYELLSSQTGIFIKSYRTQEENGILKIKFSLWEKKFENFKLTQAERLALVDELRKLG